MKLDEYISKHSTVGEMSRLLNLKQPSVSNWVTANLARRQPIPAHHCPAIERITKGLVKCEEMRPDIDWAYLRGTKKKAA